MDENWWHTVWAAVLAVIVGAAILAVVAWFASLVKRALRRPYHLLREMRKAGRLECGHWSGSYVTNANGRRECIKCHNARMKAPPTPPT
jgi:hypothetical protein